MSNNSRWLLLKLELEDGKLVNQVEIFLISDKIIIATKLMRFTDSFTQN